jgi:hypothetical protein
MDVVNSIWRQLLSTLQVVGNPLNNLDIHLYLQAAPKYHHNQQ